MRVYGFLLGKEIFRQTNATAGVMAVMLATLQIADRRKICTYAGPVQRHCKPAGLIGTSCGYMYAAVHYVHTTVTASTHATSAVA